MVFPAVLLLVAAGTAPHAAGDLPRTWDTVLTIPHPDAVLSVAYARPGATLVTACADGIVRLWGTASGELRGQLPDSSFGPVAVSADGSRLATYFKYRIRIYDLQSLEVVRSIPCSLELTLAFSSGGQHIAAGGMDKRVHVWGVADGSKQATLDAGTAAVGAVAFSPAGRRLVTGSVDQAILLWDLDAAAVYDSIRTRRAGRTGPGFVAACFSPDGSRVAAADGARAFLYPVPHGPPPIELRAFASFKGAIRTIAYAPDGRIVAAGSHQGMSGLWAANDGSPLATLVGHAGAVSSIAFSPDGRFVATGSEDRTVRIWERVEVGGCIRPPDGSRDHAAVPRLPLPSIADSHNAPHRDGIPLYISLTTKGHAISMVANLGNDERPIGVLSDSMISPMKAAAPPLNRPWSAFVVSDGSADPERACRSVLNMSATAEYRDVCEVTPALLRRSASRDMLIMSIHGVVGDGGPDHLCFGQEMVLPEDFRAMHAQLVYFDSCRLGVSLQFLEYFRGLGTLYYIAPILSNEAGESSTCTMRMFFRNLADKMAPEKALFKTRTALAEMYESNDEILELWRAFPFRVYRLN